MLQPVMRFLGAAISIYMVIILVRIVMTWFPGAVYGRTFEILQRITDPYLNLFRGARFLRIGYVDFSPLAAIILLSVLNNVVTTIGYTGKVSLGFVLATVVSAIASAISFFLTLFLILTAIRLLGTFIQSDSFGQFWMTLDRLLEPMSYRLSRSIIRDRELSYRMALTTMGVSILIVLFVGGLLLDFLIPALAALPI
ncbi:MAG: YggT family protein [Spirochaetota bacterium]